MNDPDLLDLQRRLRYTFQQPELLQRALTHASSKDRDRPSNERLEFLGDAVLGLAVGHFLFWAYPQLQEGALTRIRAAAVSAKGLARFARDLRLQDVVRLGRGLHRDTLPNSVLANVLEGVVGAIYLDGGLEPARDFALWGLAQVIDDEIAARNQPNWKSLLQEFAQHARHLTPQYRTLSSSGPDHAKHFVVAAYLGDHELARGTGKPKKAAEQLAARNALHLLAQQHPEIASLERFQTALRA